MKIFKRDSLILTADTENFYLARDYAESKLSGLKLSNQMITENRLVMEEVFVNACENSIPGESIFVSVRGGIGSSYIDIEYDGERFNIDDNDHDNDNLSAAILRGYSEKIGIRYSNSHNRVSILVNRRTAAAVKQSVILAMLGAFIGMIASNFLAESYTAAIMDVSVDIQLAFINAMIMISAPVTFFSIVTNISNLTVLSDRTVPVRHMLVDVLLTSVLALVIGLGIALTCSYLGIFDDKVFYTADSYEGFKIGSDIVPSDIFKAFTVLSPYPLIILSLIAAIGLMNMNSHFRRMKEINDAINAFIQSCLNVIYYVLPIAVLFAFIDLTIRNGIFCIFEIIAANAICYLCVPVMAALYGLRLIFNGINPITFFKDCREAIYENFKINSPINAIPYNTRFCSRKFGVSKKRLDIEIPLLSQLNHDGNCVIIMMTTMCIALVSGVNINIVGMGIIILALSVGAPNQSGSLLIGLVVTLSCMGISSEARCVIIYFEAFSGSTLGLINTLGNIAEVAIDAKKHGQLKWNYKEER